MGVPVHRASDYNQVWHIACSAYHFAHNLLDENLVNGPSLIS